MHGLLCVLRLYALSVVLSATVVFRALHAGYGFIGKRQGTP